MWSSSEEWYEMPNLEAKTKIIGYWRFVFPRLFVQFPLCGQKFGGSNPLIINPSYWATRREGQIRFGSEDRNILFIQASLRALLILKSEIFQVCHNPSLYCQNYNIKKMREFFLGGSLIMDSYPGENDYFLNLKVSSLDDSRLKKKKSKSELCKFHRDKEQIGTFFSFLEMQKSIQWLLWGCSWLLLSYSPKTK